MCFGDSNTWGCIPNRSDIDERYPVEVRWTGLLQKSLGSSYDVLEEGLNSRTTCLDYSDKPGKNGLTVLPGILKSRSPLDLVILLLGTNDLKRVFDRTPKQIAEGIEKLIHCIKVPVLLLSPPIPKLKSVYDSFRYPELEAKAKALAPLYEKVSKAHGLEFLDLGGEIKSSDEDGVHLDPNQHQKLAEKLAAVVRRLLPG